MVFRTTSPLLDKTPAAMLRECPVSLVLRETPYVYGALSAAAHLENGGLDPYRLSAWASEAVRIVSAERVRHRELKDKEKDLEREARASHG